MKGFGGGGLQAIMKQANQMQQTFRFGHALTPVLDLIAISRRAACGPATLYFEKPANESVMLRSVNQPIARSCFSGSQ